MTLDYSVGQATTQAAPPDHVGPPARVEEALEVDGGESDDEFDGDFS